MCRERGRREGALLSRLFETWIVGSDSARSHAARPEGENPAFFWRAMFINRCLPPQSILAPYRKCPPSTMNLVVAAFGLPLSTSFRGGIAQLSGGRHHEVPLHECEGCGVAEIHAALSRLRVSTGSKHDPFPRWRVLSAPPHEPGRPAGPMPPAARCSR